jgi:hypothetical protein
VIGKVILLAPEHYSCLPRLNQRTQQICGAGSFSVRAQTFDTVPEFRSLDYVLIARKRCSQLDRSRLELKQNVALLGLMTGVSKKWAGLKALLRVGRRNPPEFVAAAGLVAGSRCRY